MNLLSPITPAPPCVGSSWRSVFFQSPPTPPNFKFLAFQPSHPKVAHLGCYGNGGVSSPTLRPTTIKKEGVCVMSPCFLFLLPPPYLSCPLAEKLAPGSCIHLVEMLTCRNAWVSLKPQHSQFLLWTLFRLKKLDWVPGKWLGCLSVC